MKCADCRALLSDLVYGDLDPERVASVRRHLERCHACRGERDDLRRTVDALDAWTPVESADDARVIAAVAAARSAAAPPAPAWRRPGAWLTGLAAAVLVFVGLILVRADITWANGRLMVALGAPPVGPVGPVGPGRAISQISEDDLVERVHDEVGLDRRLVLTAIEGRLAEWEVEQEMKYIALIDALRSARAEDRAQVMRAVRLVAMSIENGSRDNLEMVP